MKKILINTRLGVVTHTSSEQVAAFLSKHGFIHIATMEGFNTKLTNDPTAEYKYRTSKELVTKFKNS